MRYMSIRCSMTRATHPNKRTNTSAGCLPLPQSNTTLQAEPPFHPSTNTFSPARNNRLASPLATPHQHAPTPNPTSMHPATHRRAERRPRAQHGYVKTAVRSITKLAQKRCEKLGRAPPSWCSKAVRGPGSLGPVSGVWGVVRVGAPGCGWSMGGRGRKWVNLCEV